MTGSRANHTRLALLALSIGGAPILPTAIHAADTPGYPTCAASHLDGVDPMRLKRALVDAVGPNIARPDADRFFSDNVVLAAPAPLSRGHSDVIVYTQGPRVCGSGGCNLYVLARKAGGASSRPSYRLLGKVTAARPPVSVLPTIHNGRHDLGVGVAGGGIRDPYTAALAFDGKRYPGNPTLPGIPRGTGDMGHVILASADGSGPQCRLR